MRLALSDSLIGIPLAIEFYPAFARLPGHAWRGTARVRFLGPDERMGEGGSLSVVAGGRTVLRLPNAPSLEMPDGFGTLIETRVTTLTGSVAARRTVVTTGPRGAGGGVASGDRGWPSSNSTGRRWAGGLGRLV